MFGGYLLSLGGTVEIKSQEYQVIQNCDWEKHSPV